MNILFIHRTFPGQFESIIREFAKNPDNVVAFITNKKNTPEIKGVIKYVCEPEQKINSNCHPYLGNYEEAVIRGLSTAKKALEIKNKGFKPDIIYGFSGWGNSMFIKTVFPDVPFLCYFEWFELSKNSVFDFDGTIPDESVKANIMCNNSHIIQNLISCDAGICPTNWQKNQFPKEFHDKIKVIHDGINTDFCKPDNSVKIFIEDKNIELTIEDEIITYGTRGLEPYRGFPEFMEAVEKLLKKRPNAHFLIAGADISCYSPKLANGTYKELMLQKLNIDMDRVHFIGTLPFEHYIKLLQISSVHVYLTYPYVLSWSILNAMATGCCVIASNNNPVLEVIKDNYNGLLVDFFNVNRLTQKIEYALDNQDKMKELRQNARKTVLDKYDIKSLFPQHIEYVKSFLSSS